MKVNHQRKEGAPVTVKIVYCFQVLPSNQDSYQQNIASGSFEGRI